MDGGVDRYPSVILLKPMTSKIRNIDELPTEELMIEATGERLALARSISDAFGLSNLLVHIELLSPGRRASSAHRHSIKEEIFMVLEGAPSLWLDGQVSQMAPGDVVGFRPREGARMIVNESSSNAVILTIGTNDRNDVIEYFREEG